MAQASSLNNQEESAAINSNKKTGEGAERGKRINLVQNVCHLR